MISIARFGARFSGSRSVCARSVRMPHSIGSRAPLLDYYHALSAGNCVDRHGPGRSIDALVRRYLAQWLPDRSCPPPRCRCPRGPQRVTVRGPLPAAESELMIGMRTVEWTHPDRWALAVLAEIMDEALLKAIRVQRGLAYDVHAFMDYFTDTGYFGLTTQFESAHRAEVQRLIEDYFEQVRRAVTAEQVAMQTALIGNYVLALETISGPNGWRSGRLSDNAAARLRGGHSR
jgi:predicted Zn-dependent peptidase